MYIYIYISPVSLVDMSVIHIKYKMVFRGYKPVELYMKSSTYRMRLISFIVQFSTVAKFYFLRDSCCNSELGLRIALKETSFTKI